MFSNEVHKLYRHLIPDGARVLMINEPVNVIETYKKEPHDIILIVLDRAEIVDIQDFLEVVKTFLHAGTRVIFDWPAPWWRCFSGTRSRNAFSVRDMQQIAGLAGYERVSAGTFELLPWSIPVLSWIFNSFLARLPFIGALCQRRYLVLRPLMLAKKAQEVTVSVIVPCRNERGNIESAVKRIPEMGVETEIIFVEGHSADNTLAEIERVAMAYPAKKISWCVQPGKGKGDAVRAGFARARGDVLMILDADLTVQPEELPKFLSALVENKGECINGSRLIYSMESGAMQTLNWLANHFFAMLFSWLMGQRVTDTLCGTKVLWKKDYERIAANRAYFGEFDPFGDFDLLFGAAKLQLKITDVPVHYKSRVYGSTQIRRFVHGWILLGMSLYAMRKLKFY